MCKNTRNKNVAFCFFLTLYHHLFNVILDTIDSRNKSTCISTWYPSILETVKYNIILVFLELCSDSMLDAETQTKRFQNSQIFSTDIFCRTMNQLLISDRIIDHFKRTYFISMSVMPMCYIKIAKQGKTKFYFKINIFKWPGFDKIIHYALNLQNWSIYKFAKSGATVGRRGSTAYF